MMAEPRFHRNPRVIHQELSGEEGSVLLHLDTGAYHTLTPVATRIWELLSLPAAEAEIVERLEAEFDAESEVLRRDVDEFLRELKARELVREDPSS